VDTNKIDLLVQYALVVAGQGDYGERELGAIHVLKYVYLGDLAYAERNEGATFTGAPWRFHNFGPWAAPVYDRVQESVRTLPVQERRFTSWRLEGEGVRWCLYDARLADRLDDKLPLAITSAMRRAIKEYGDDTTALLDYVYRTAPMLHAAPGELLDFTVAEAPERTSPPVPKRAPSGAEMRHHQERLTALQQRVQTKLRERAAARRLVSPDPAPRYDAVFADGQVWLDALAGKPIGSSHGTVTFSDDIWKSPGRRDPGVS